MQVAVVGHVEWIEFAEVDHVPEPGEIVHADRTFQLPAGGGAVAAVQLAKLAGAATLYTAFGDDELGHRAERELRALGIEVQCVFRDEPQRRGFVYLDSDGERTITVLGPRLGPGGADPLPWERLDETDAVYLTAGDAEAVRHARRAGALVASARGLPTLVGSGVELDVLVASGKDAGERYERGQLDPPPRYVVRTLGAAGGSWETPDRSGGKLGGDAAAGAARRCLRLGRQLRRGAHLRHGQVRRHRRGRQAGGALRGGVRDRPRAL